MAHDGYFLAARSRAFERKESRPSLAAMDFSASAGPDLLFRVLLAALSNQGPHRTHRGSPRRRLPASSFSHDPLAALLVRTFAVLARLERPRPDARLLDRYRRVAAARFQYLAARNACRLLRLLPFVRGCRTGLFQLSIGRDAPRSGLHLALFRAARISAGAWARERAITPQSLSPPVGVVPDLFRVRSRKNCERRS